MARRETQLDSIVALTDSYKWTHWPMYPDSTEIVQSYYESRSGAEFPETVFFGLQYPMMRYLEGVVVTKERIDFAEMLAKKHFGSDKVFNREGWDYILNECGGKLPVRIRAVPEGLPVPINNVMMTVENTGGKKTKWLTNHLETILFHVWASSTVATLSRAVKQDCKRYLELTADSLDALPFMLHDFGFRGVTSVESAGFTGAGHLVNFMGTDTIPAIILAMEYYGSDVCGFSIPATEHSVMTSLGPEGESEVFEKILDEFPTGFVSVVSDSYDIYRAAEEIIGGQFREQILKRDGVFVVRPDSGEPVSTVMKLMDILGDKFGTTVNSKGYKVLDPHIRLIWGDGLGREMINKILQAMMESGWSAENIVFGMGGGLLQKINRDTQRSAFKCCWQLQDGVGVDIYKRPLDLSKASKKGRLALIEVETPDGVTLKTVSEEEAGENDILQIVFENGVVVKAYTFDEVRANSEKSYICPGAYEMVA